MKNFKQQCLDYVVFTHTTVTYQRYQRYDYLVVGLADEVLEFYLERIDSDNKLAELGDVMWYVARIADELVKDVENCPEEGIEAVTFGMLASEALESVLQSGVNDVVLCEENMLRAACRILAVKKRVSRGDDMDVATRVGRVRDALVEIIKSAMLYARHHNVHPGMQTAERWLDVLRMNQEKLQSRLERDVIKGEGDKR